MDLIPAHRASDLQVILRTRDHAALYDPSSNSLSMQSRLPLSSGYSQSRSLAPVHQVEHDHRALPFYGSARQDRASPFETATEVVPHNAVCPTCYRPWPLRTALEDESGGGDGRLDQDAPAYIAPNYFRLLAQATSVPGSTTHSRPATPTLSNRRFAESQAGSRSSTPEIGADGHVHNRTGERAGQPVTSEPLQRGSEAEGYYSRFFVEIKRLGRGARGTVFLCQHVLNGNKLGKYAIKKIPVGDHAESLLKSLNEVHLMESLHHPHLIHYQHAWIESCQLSSFAPRVPTLHVLMMAANGGSLADWISARSGEAANDSPRPSNTDSPSASGRSASSGARVEKPAGGSSSPAPDRARFEKLKAALRQRRAQREAQQAGTSSGKAVHSGLGGSLSFGDADRSGVGVHFLRDDEIYSLMHDMTSGLGFLHDRGILHLDIKPGNVLLHWDEDALVPRAMLSDFGSSMLLHENWTRKRSGHTGTMEYMAPETLTRDPITGKLSELSSKADLWSLGMILHLLLFFHLPYSQVEDVDRLRDEMLAYRGFTRSSFEAQGVAFRRQRPNRLIKLLERLLDLYPANRPSCHEVLQILSAGPESNEDLATAESLTVYRRSSTFGDWFANPSNAAAAAAAVVDEDSELSRRSPLPRRLSLGPPTEGKMRDARRRRIDPHRRHLSSGERIADLIWTLTGLDLDPCIVRMVMAISLCLFKLLSLDLYCWQHGDGARPARTVAYSVLLLSLGEIAVSSFAKTYTTDLLVTSALLAIHLAMTFVPSAGDVCSS